MLPFTQKLLDAQLLFNSAFLEGVESLKEGVDLVYEFKTEVIPCAGVQETVFGYLNEMPLFRRWIGEREIKRISTSSYSVRVENYEFTLGVGRDDIKFDRIGILKPVFRGYGVAQKRFWPDLVNDAQRNGKTVTCVDGQYFYDTDHPVGFGQLSTSTFANLFTSMTLNATNIWTRYHYMCSLLDGNGKKMGIRPNVLEYGTGQIEKVRTALSAEIIGQAVSNAGVFNATSSVVGAAGVSNNLLGLLTPVMNPDLEAGVWNLHDTRTMKPFLLLNETPPTGLITRTDLADPHVFDFNEYLYGAEATAAAAYTMPHLSVRCEE